MVDIAQITGICLASKFDTPEAYVAGVKELGVDANNVEIFRGGIQEIHQASLSEIDGTLYLGVRPTEGFYDGGIPGLDDVEWDWLNNFLAVQVEIPGIPGKVHKGFYQCAKILWDNGLKEALQRRLPNVSSLNINGYSKGGGVAYILAAMVEWELFYPTNRIDIYAFASPRAGDVVFRNYMEDYFRNIQRYEYQDDIIVRFAPEDIFLDFLNEKWKIFEILDNFFNTGDWNYKSCGNLNFIDWNEEIIVGQEAEELTPERLMRMMDLLRSDNRAKLGGDHSVPKKMYPVLSGGKELPESILALYS